MHIHTHHAWAYPAALQETEKFYLVSRDALRKQSTAWQFMGRQARYCRWDSVRLHDSVLFLFGREASETRPFEELYVACARLLDDARVKVCSGLGWCHVAVDQGLEFSFPGEI